MTRVLAPGGHILVVEETDPALEAGDVAQAEAGYTRGRPWSWYSARFAPLQLIRMGPRVIEPGYPRADVGTFMLFGPGRCRLRPRPSPKPRHWSSSGAVPAGRWSSPTASTTCCTPATCGISRPLVPWATRSSSASTPTDRSAPTRARRGPSTPKPNAPKSIAALECVDAAVVFDQDTPHQIISRLQPDVLVKGADWAEDAIVGRDVVEARGGRVVRMPIEQGFSTTELIARIQAGSQEIRRSRDQELTGDQEIRSFDVLPGL